MMDWTPPPPLACSLTPIHAPTPLFNVISHEFGVPHACFEAPKQDQSKRVKPRRAWSEASRSAFTEPPRSEKTSPIGTNSPRLRSMALHSPMFPRQLRVSHAGAARRLFNGKTHCCQHRFKIDPLVNFSTPQFPRLPTASTGGSLGSATLDFTAAGYRKWARDPNLESGLGCGGRSTVGDNSDMKLDDSKLRLETGRREALRRR